MAEKNKIWDNCEATTVDCCGCLSCTLSRKKVKEKIINRIIKAIKENRKLSCSDNCKFENPQGSIYFWEGDETGSEAYINIGWLNPKQINHLIRFHNLKLN